MRAQRIAAGILVATAAVVAGCGDDDDASSSTSTAADGGGDSIAGTYECLPDPAPTDPDFRAETWELQEDGTLTITPPEGESIEASWSVEGDTATIHFPQGDDEFTVEADRLVARAPSGPEGSVYTCVKQD
jgi:hypothetical protein